MSLKAVTFLLSVYHWKARSERPSRIDVITVVYSRRWTLTKYSIFEKGVSVDTSTFPSVN